MNGHLDSMARVPHKPIEPMETSMQGLQEAPAVSIKKLGQYFESDDTNAVIPISYQGQAITAILDGGARVSIMTRQC